jgi:hypothetical protein
MSERSCGSCTACCTALQVHAMNKPDWQRCVELNPKKKRCRIYPRRPEECRRYKCEWLKGTIPREHRPDKLGAVFSMVGSHDLGDCLMVHELKPGAFKPGSLAYQLALRYADDLLVFEVGRDGMRYVVMGPTHRMAEVFERTRRQLPILK